MKFKATDVIALIVYVDDKDSTEWYLTDQIWYNIGDIVEVDPNFEYVVEPYFVRDLLEGHFVPFDEEAQKYAETVLMESKEDIAQ